jgi:sulfur carrier protein
MLPSMSDARPRPAEITIQVNGEAKRLGGPCTIEALIDSLGMAERRVAVAVNREVVPRSEFAHRMLTSGDRVEILQAVGGGS